MSGSARTVRGVTKRIAMGMLLGVSGALVVAVAVGALLRSGPSVVVDQTFKRSTWIEHRGVYDMCDDLLQHHLCVGMPRAEVIALLGEPTIDKPDFIAWDVGGIPGRYLDISFDAEGRLSKMGLSHY
jgi:hypothetical protein